KPIGLYQINCIPETRVTNPVYRGSELQIPNSTPSSDHAFGRLRHHRQGNQPSSDHHGNQQWHSAYNA
ncbi:MAG: hypothetical protein WD431_24400, partial [Cyclobacteriaceae bacterium]